MLQQAVKTNKLLRKHGALYAVDSSKQSPLDVFSFNQSKQSGVYDPTISDMASCGKSGNHRNASRNLYRLVHRKKKTLPVEISKVVIPIRASRRRKVQKRQWPVLHLSSWVKVCFQEPYDGFFILGGYKLKDLPAVEDMLERFWERYAYVDSDRPTHPRRTIPYFLHGDEGRGQCKRPLLILSFQPVLGWSGEDHVNSKKFFGNINHIFIWCAFCWIPCGAKKDLAILIIMNPKALLHNTFALCSSS